MLESPVVHEEQLELLHVVDEELVEAVGQEVAGALVRSYRQKIRQAREKETLNMKVKKGDDPKPYRNTIGFSVLHSDCHWSMANGRQLRCGCSCFSDTAMLLFPAECCITH